MSSVYNSLYIVFFPIFMPQKIFISSKKQDYIRQYICKINRFISHFGISRKNSTITTSPIKYSEVLKSKMTHLSLNLEYISGFNSSTYLHVISLMFDILFYSTPSLSAQSSSFLILFHTKNPKSVLSYLSCFSKKVTRIIHNLDPYDNNIFIYNVFSYIFYIIPENKARRLYSQYFLPFSEVVSINSSDHPISFITSLCSKYPHLISITLKYYLRLFEKYPHLYFKILKSLECILTIQISQDIFPDFQMELMYIIKNGLKSKSFLVISKVYGILTNSSIEKHIKNHLTYFLPIVFDDIYDISKKFWRIDQRCQMLLLLSKYSFQNYKLFKECLINYNIRKYSLDN